MKTSITHAERLRVAEWILDARQLLIGVENIERHIAATLGFTAADNADLITDAIGTTMTIDHLLSLLEIAVDEDSAGPDDAESHAE